jgi:signal peptidase I
MDDRLARPGGPLPRASSDSPTDAKQNAPEIILPDDFVPTSIEPSSDKKDKKKASILKWFTRTLVILIILSFFTLRMYRQPSDMMFPTIPPNSYFLVCPNWYRLFDVRRGEIIMFEYPRYEDGERQLASYVSRVIGLPGETVQYDRKSGAVSINGESLSGYSGRDINTEWNRYRPIDKLVPPDTYYVLNDNRSNMARDSRNTGFIKREQIRGKMICVFWRKKIPEKFKGRSAFKDVPKEDFEDEYSFFGK